MIQKKRIKLSWCENGWENWCLKPKMFSSRQQKLLGKSKFSSAWFWWERCCCNLPCCLVPAAPTDQRILWAESLAKCLTFSLQHSDTMLMGMWDDWILPLSSSSSPGPKLLSVHHLPPDTRQREILNCPEEGQFCFVSLRMQFLPYFSVFFFSRSCTAYSMCCVWAMLLRANLRGVVEAQAIWL